MHWLRPIASIALNESGYNADIIGAGLSHIGKNEVRRAYNRSTYLSQRVPLMQWWGNMAKKGE